MGDRSAWILRAMVPLLVSMVTVLVSPLARAGGWLVGHAPPADAAVDGPIVGKGVAPPTVEQATRMAAKVRTKAGVTVRRTRRGIMRRPPGLRGTRWLQRGGPPRE